MVETCVQGGFKFPEEIMVPELPGFCEGNHGNGKDSQEDSLDLSDREDCLVQEEETGTDSSPKECEEPAKARE